uniref:Uncharacterized protein n=1 Tax=Zea mays TaxID=4577 RepID=A0A804RB52_MAIZE
MAISTDSQILGDPHRVAGSGVQEPEGDGQLLTMVKQWRLLLLLCNGVQHVPGIGHVALCPDLPHHVPGHGVHLLRPGVAQAAALELADLTLDLDHRPPCFLAHVPLVHQPPDPGHVLPPAGRGEEVRQQHIAPAVLGIQLNDAPPDRLAQVDVAVYLGRAEERTEDADVWLHRHVLDNLLGFLQPPCSSIQVDHAAVVLHLGLNAVSLRNVVEVVAALAEHPRVRAGSEHVHQRDVVRRHALPLHPSEQLQSVLAPPVHREPADHAVPRREPLGSEREGLEHTPRLLDAAALAVHVHHRGGQLLVHLDPALLHPPVHLPPARQRAGARARHHRGSRDEDVAVHPARPHLVEHLQRVQEPAGLDVPGHHRVPRHQVSLRHPVEQHPRVVEQPQLEEPADHRGPRHDVESSAAAAEDAGGEVGSRVGEVGGEQRVERLRVGVEAELEEQRVELGDQVERLGAREDLREGEVVRAQGQG